MINHPNLGRKRRESAQALANAIPTSPGFHQIKAAIAAQFQRMSAHELFRTGVEKDALWDTYLASFPEGTNPILRKRTEHDCSCCRQFVRAIGGVVAVIEGKLTSVWDINIVNPAYEAVSDAMSALVKSTPIDNRFLHTEAKVGTDRNFEDGESGVKTWEHFFVTLPNSRVCSGKDIGPRLSEARALHDVLLRSLTELTPEAVNTVLELIAQNTLYRGEEHKRAVAAFHQLQSIFGQLAPEDRDNFTWLQSTTLPGAVSKIRNTSIGTLLTELSEGMDVEKAVSRFEAMVAPANYKRPTALVTPSMVAKAKATVEELGLTSALDRRYARLTDITVNNILFADRGARKIMEGGAFDGIATAPTKAKSFDKIEEIGIDAFLADVLPKADSLEVLVQNRHIGNLVSLIAPVDPKAGLLFKWQNGFSWSYNGDFADSIKERVKKAGGNVSGDLCCRLAWSNYDDLDFHMIEPRNEHIYYGYKRSSSGGELDVDMNAMRAATRNPVENIFYGNAAKMREGTYKLYVHQYCTRESKDVGFEAEIDWKGTVARFAYPKALRQGETVNVAELRYTHAAGVEIVSSLPGSVASRKVWNLDTETFHRANVVMLSPNHWDGHGVGNRHYFFMLDGCTNDGTARGFYNEFLRGDLDPHRKTFEIVGAKMRTDESASQLSGLGFSTTQRNHVVVRVKNRAMKVVF